MDGNEIKKMQTEYCLQSWSKQKNLNPIPIERAEGIYMWDTEGNRYTDMSSQLVNLNVGHGCKPIIDAIKDQAEKYCYLSPAYGSEPRAKLAKMIVELMPDNIAKVFFTNDEAKTKTSLAAPSLFPSLALLDHKYMSGLPINVTINTAIDALSHAVEGMLSNKASVVTDALAVKSISDICSCFADMKSGSLSPEQREKLLTASTMAGAVIANTGTTAVHSMGYSLTYFKHIDHGRANGLLLPEFLRFVLKTKPEKVGEIIEACGFGSVDSFKNAVDELLGERETLTKEELELFPKIAVKAKNIANCVVVPDEKVLRETYKNSLPVV